MEKVYDYAIGFGGWVGLLYATKYLILSQNLQLYSLSLLIASPIVGGMAMGGFIYAVTHGIELIQYVYRNMLVHDVIIALLIATLLYSIVISLGTIAMSKLFVVQHTADVAAAESSATDAEDTEESEGAEEDEDSEEADEAEDAEESEEAEKSEESEDVQTKSEESDVGLDTTQSDNSATSETESGNIADSEGDE